MTKKVAIIGAGFLGLSLAYYLAKDGYSVTVFEKNSELGGLASGLKIQGANIEKYYHHWFRSDTAVQNMIAEMGLSKDLEFLPSKVGVFDGKKLYDFSTALDLLRFNKISFLARLRSGLVALKLQKNRDYRQYEKISALDWCKKNFGKEATDAIWEPLLRGKFGKFYSQVSMSWLWARIFDRSSSRSQPLALEKLGYLKNGFQELLDALIGKCRKLSVNLKTEIQIESHEYKSGQHVITFKEKSGKINSEKFDIVVGNLPAPVFAKLFRVKRESKSTLDRVKYLGAICMILVLKKQFMPYYWLNISDPNLPFLAVVEHTNFVSPKRFKNKHILYVAKYVDPSEELYNMSDRDLIDLYLKNLCQINPEFSEEWIEEKYLFRANFAQHIVNVGYEPPPYETGIPGLYFANFCQIYPHDRGTNYAIVQAKELAELISKK